MSHIWDHRLVLPLFLTTTIENGRIYIISALFSLLLSLDSSFTTLRIGTNHTRERKQELMCDFFNSYRFTCLSVLPDYRSNQHPHCNYKSKNKHESITSTSKPSGLLEQQKKLYLKIYNIYILVTFHEEVFFVLFLKKQKFHEIQ